MKKYLTLITLPLLAACSSTVMEPEEIEQPVETIKTCTIESDTQVITIAACVPMYLDGQGGWLDANCNFRTDEFIDYATCIGE